MKTLTAVLVMWLVGSTLMCWAEKVTDGAGKEWTCRVIDGTIYNTNGAGYHIYDIQAALGAHETDSTNHDPICISPMKERIIWSWPKAKNISVTFKPITMDKGVCQNSSQPFRSPPPNSKDYDFVGSDIADDTYSSCAYELSFTSSLGEYDPHIIIRGDRLTALKKLKEELEHLEAEVQRVEKDLEHLEKAEEQDTKHH